MVRKTEITVYLESHLHAGRQPGPELLKVLEQCVHRKPCPAPAPAVACTVGKAARALGLGNLWLEQSQDDFSYINEVIFTAVPPSTPAPFTVMYLSVQV